jgi:hypothetical protein
VGRESLNTYVPCVVGHAHGVDLVLDQHRNAMQRPGEARLLVGCVELVGFFQRVRVIVITELMFGPPLSSAR